MKQGRNQLCQCGSGKKYKRCCGALNGTPALEFGLDPGPIPSKVLQIIAKHDAERTRHEATHGAVKRIITATNGEVRIVASGRKLAYSQTWKVFTDFLGDHLAGLLGKEWGSAQVALPVSEQHPVVQWRTLNALAQQGAMPDEQGRYKVDTGAGNAWFRLAYDLYLIDHNADLQGKLLRRLRKPEQSQGARFEAAVAAMMLASGYDLEFCDEKGPGRHPEFYATHRESGHVLAVEAKSRHRDGIFGFESYREPVPPDSLDIDRLLRAAVSKDTKEPLLVFIELNVPTMLDQVSYHAIYHELDTAWKGVQSMEWPSGFPSIGVVFYNDTSSWHLNEALPKGGNSVWALVLWPWASRHLFDSKSLLERIAQGCVQRCNIPLDFPGESQGSVSN